MKDSMLSLSAAILGAVLLSMSVQAGATASQAEEVPETLTATTANMDAAGEDLKFNVLRWSSAEDRQAVVEAVKGMMGSVASPEGSEESSSGQALSDLPTVGYVWLGSSSVGYDLKYTHREQAPDGGEHITFVTEPRLGTYGRAPWTAVDASEPTDDPFTVIELRLDDTGAGEGTMSIATEITLDEASGTVALTDYDSAPVLLDGVKRLPPPYSARTE